MRPSRPDHPDAHTTCPTANQRGAAPAVGCVRRPIVNTERAPVDARNDRTVRTDSTEQNEPIEST
jgi:hypothetical protein